MSSPTDLVVGLAEHLHAAGLGVWDPTGRFPGLTPEQAAITLKLMPAEPAWVIAITPYLPTDDLVGGRVQRIQIRTRAPGMPTAVDDLEDAIYQALHGLCDVTLGGVPVASMQRISTATLGRDNDDRWGLSSNYTALVDGSTAHTD